MVEAMAGNTIHTQRTKLILTNIPDPYLNRIGKAEDDRSTYCGDLNITDSIICLQKMETRWVIILMTKWCSSSQKRKNWNMEKESYSTFPWFRRPLEQLQKILAETVYQSCTPPLKVRHCHLEQELGLRCRYRIFRYYQHFDHDIFCDINRCDINRDNLSDSRYNYFWFISSWKGKRKWC